MERFEDSDVWGMDYSREGEYVLFEDIPIDAIRTLIGFAYNEGYHVEAADEVYAWLEVEGKEEGK